MEEPWRNVRCKMNKCKKKNPNMGKEKFQAHGCFGPRKDRLWKKSKWAIILIIRRRNVCLKMKFTYCWSRKK
jgi:hypothetical protein